MEKAFVIRNKDGDFLLYTIWRQRDASIKRLITLKQQSWDELQAEGYEVIEVIIMDAYEIPNADEFGPEDLSSDEEYKSSFLFRPCRVCGRDIEFDPYAPYYVCDICATYYGIDR